MATIFNDNIQVNSPKDTTNKSGKFTGGVWRPYNSIQEVYDTLYDINDNPKFVSRGLFVHILLSGVNTVYWFRDGILKTDLIPFNPTGITISDTPLEDGTQAISTGWAFTIDERVTALESATEPTYTLSIPVVLSSGKSFGKYVNGDTATYVSKTISYILTDIAQEVLAPTLTLTSPTTVAFNQSSINNQLNYTITPNPGTDTISTLSLEFRRNNTGSWSVLSTDTGLTTFTHILTDPLQFSGATNSNGTNVHPFNYRLVVVMTSGGTATKTLDITPQSYTVSTGSVTLTANTVGSNNTGNRELGDISSTIGGTVTRGSANCPLVSYQLQYNVNSGGYFNLGSPVVIIGNPSSQNITPVVHNDVALVNSTALGYRVQFIDTYQQFISSVINSSSQNISLLYKSTLGYDVDTTITLVEILAMGNTSLTNSKARTVSPVTSTGDTYTYYNYAASSGDLTNIIMDGAAPVLGAFTKLSDVSGTNTFGASVTYRVYKSNSTNAFSSNSLAFS